MSRSDRILVAAAAGAIVLAVAAVAVLLMPTGAAEPSAGNDPAALLLESPSASAPFGSVAPASGTIVVDVEGAVAVPGIRELAAASRIADAIEAAGGYAADADLVAAASVNLAQYGLTARPGCFFVKNYSESTGLPDALATAGIAVPVGFTTVGQFGSVVVEMRLVAGVEV